MLSLNKFDNPWEKKNNDESYNKSGRSTNSGEDLFSIINKILNKLLKLGNAGNNNQPSNEKGSSNILLLLLFLLALLLIWLVTGFYTVNTNEEGVVMRLGKYNRTSIPGLNYKLPSPIESVDKVSVTRINKELIGIKKANKDSKDLSFNNTSDESDTSSDIESNQMLTGDENIIDMHFFVQWYIKDAKDYLFNIKEDLLGENTVRIVSESAMREVIGTVKLYEALSEQRQGIEQKVRQIVQDTLDSYKSGIQIDSIGILYSYVAPEVMDAYRDVQSAKADKEREINQAQAYRNDVIPKARGEAQAIIEEARAYRESVVAKAKGEASRYSSVYNQYQKSKEVTRRRIYLETMEEVLSKVDKVIVSKQSSSPLVPFMPMPNIFNKSNSDSNASIVSK